MKRVYLFAVIVYSGLILLLNDLPFATSYSDAAALPFMVKCLVDFCFGGFAAFKMFGSQIHWDDDEEIGIHADDLKLPDAWFYGIFGLNLIGNFGWHGWLFAHLNGASALYNALWFFAEFAAVALTFIFYKHSVEVMRREARKASAPQGAAKPPFRQAV